MKKIIIVTSITSILLVIAYFLLTPRTLPPVHLTSLLPAKYEETGLKNRDIYLIKNVSVIPMNRDTIMPNHNVLIEKGRIKQIARVLDDIDTSSTPYTIDGAGKYLIPGLNDMHVHLNDDNNLLLFVANGVTTVRNMAGYPFHLALRKKINNREILGPTLYTTSPILEGINNVWKFSVIIKTKNDAREAVKKYQRDGYDFIKVYHTLPEDLYREILRVGDSIHIPVVGHIPFQVDLKQTLTLSQYSLEHVDVSPMSPDVSLVNKLEMIGRSKKWMCPTLVVYRNMRKHPNDPTIKTNYEQYVDMDTRKFWKQRLHYYSQDNYELQKIMAKLIFKNGGRFLTGTDCLNTYVLAGFSIHEELEELVSAGLPEFEVLKAATVNAAEFLKRRNDIGTVETGKIADLVLLNGNPLNDISNTKKIDGVMIKGKWLNVNQINGMLNDVKKSYPN